MKPLPPTPRTQRTESLRFPARKVWGALLLGALLPLAGCKPHNEDPAPSFKVETSTFEVAVEEIGVLEASRVVSITAPFGARIIKLADNGTAVKAGDVVAVLDTREPYDRLKARIDEQKGVKADLEQTIEELTMDLRGNALDLSATQAQLDLARVELEDVNRNLSELELLAARNIVAPEDVRDGASQLRSREIQTTQSDLDFRREATGSVSTLTSRETRIGRLGLRSENLQDRIREAQESLAAAEVKSPVEGMFLRHRRWNWQQRRNAERQPGENVNEDDLLGTIPDVSTMRVRTQVPEGRMNDVRPGMAVQLVFDALGGLQLPGTVESMGRVAIERETSAGGQLTAGGEQLTGEKVFELVVTLKQTDPRLRPGLTVRSRILLDRREGLLTVPLETIETRDGKHFVRVRKGEGTAEREVRIGQANQDRVEIVQGLTAGEEVLSYTPAAPKRG